MLNVQRVGLYGQILVLTLLYTRLFTIPAKSQVESRSQLFSEIQGGSWLKVLAV